MPGRTARVPADFCPAGAPSRRGAKGLLPALAIFLVAALRATAQDPAPPADNGWKFAWQGGALQITDDPAGGRIITMTSSVVVTHASLKVFADNLVVWVREGVADLPGSPAFQLREFYAEGHLRMENGRQVLEGERAYINLETGTLLVEKARLRTQSKRREIPISLTAGELRRIGQGDTTGHDVTVSTCDFEVPDYHLVAKEVDIHGAWKSGDIDVYGVTLHINPLDFPIFYTPYLPVSFGPQMLPLRKLRYAKTTNFGPSVFSKFGIDIPATHHDDDGKPRLDEDGEPDTDRWGSVGFDLDWMTRRGLGFGPEYEYLWDGYKGFGDVYYLHDKGDVPPSDFNNRLYPIEKQDRGRGRFFHRQSLWKNLSADLELHYVSDRNFREEFLEKEFKEDKAPETYLLLRYMYDNFAMTGLYRPRINTFQDYIEYLPQVTQSLVDQPLPWGLYLSHHAQWANVRSRKDIAVEDVEQPHTVRWDTDETLTRPFSLGPVRIMPWVAGRYSYYDGAPSSDWWVDRYALAWGARARIAAWRTAMFSNDLLRVEGIRHIVSLEGRWFNQYTTVPSRNLWQFDAVDQVDRFQEIALELRNRFETKNLKTGEIYDALNIGLSLEFYPNANRDTSRKTPQNVLYPAHWITVAPDNRGRYQPRLASNINLDVEAVVRDELTLTGTADWNPYTHNIEETHAEFRVLAAKNLTFKLTQQYVRGLTGTVGAGFEWRLSEKWTLLGESDYDFKAGRSLKHEYGIRRNLHDFDLELSLHYNGGRNEFGASVSLIPHGKKEKRLQGP